MPGTPEGSRLARLARWTGPRFAALAVCLVTAPFWLIRGLGLVVLAAARPLVVGLLVCGAIGGSVAGLWFAWVSAWVDAAEAGLVALASSVLLAAYLRLVERFDDGEQELFRWWYL